MGKADLQLRAHSLVDDVVCQGVRYWFELSAFVDGCHATALMRSASAESPVHGGLYRSLDRMLAQAPADLLQQGVPPSVVDYVKDSLRVFMMYR